MTDGGKIIKRTDKSSYAISLDKGAETAFALTGIIPEYAKEGDIFLVKVMAQYPETKLGEAKNIEFLQVLHVTDKRD